MWNDEDVTDRVENRHLRVNAETRSGLSVNFVKSGYATLTVAALGQHSVTTMYRDGEAPTVTLTPVEGHTLYILHLMANLWKSKMIIRLFCRLFMVIMCSMSYMLNQ